MKDVSVGSAVFSTGRSKWDQSAFDFDDSDDNSRPDTSFGNAINHQQPFTTTMTSPRLYPNIRGPAVNNMRTNSNRKAFADEKVSKNADEFDEYTEDEVVVYEAAERRSVGGANRSSHVTNDAQRPFEEKRASNVIPATKQTIEEVQQVQSEFEVAANGAKVGRLVGQRPRRHHHRRRRHVRDGHSQTITSSTAVAQSRQRKIC
jgi:hypothetical protein